MARFRQTRFMILGFAMTVAIIDAQAEPGIRADWGKGDVSAQSFAEYCWGELPAKREATFYAEFNKAKQAVAARNSTAARTAMGKASSAVYRGGAEDDTSVKCLGKSVARRWLSTKLAMQRLAKKPGLYVTAADHGSTGLVNLVSTKPAMRFVQSIQKIKEITNRIEANRKYGAFILPKEETIATACRDALGPLRQQAGRKHQAELAAEDQVFTQPMTRQEISAVDATSGIEVFARAITGVEFDATVQKETALMRQRARESQKLLSSARTWDLTHYDNVQSSPTSQRARKRGDMMLAKANDTKLSFGARDKFYQSAITYYKFGSWHNQVTKTESARDAIQAALKVEQERRQEARREAKDEMALKAGQLKQAQEKMIKTEAEKQRFKNEADALEAELDL